MFITPSFFAIPATQLFFHINATIRALFKALLSETILLIYKCVSLESVEVTGVCSPHAAPDMLERMLERHESTRDQLKPAFLRSHCSPAVFDSQAEIASPGEVFVVFVDAGFVLQVVPGRGTEVRAVLLEGPAPDLASSSCSLPTKYLTKIFQGKKVL